jgi:MFS family permease
MYSAAPPRLSAAERRRSMRLAYVNGGLWAIGNGLASTTLLIYLVFEWGAKGQDIGYILATPSLVGVLRLAAPALMRRINDRKRFCVGSFLLSGIVLSILPIIASPGLLPTRTTSIVLIVAIWSIYHLLEYLATVALWSWLSELAPRRIRGRFIGIRERWLTLGRIGGMLAGGVFAQQWKMHASVDLNWLAYAIPAAAGAVFLLVAVTPLLRMAPLGASFDTNTQAPLDLMAPLGDRRFVRLLWFGCWFSLFNGITQAAQAIYPMRVLVFSLLWMNVFRTGMRLGQSGASPWVGRLVDRIGNRPVMIVSQLLVAAGPLFFLAATPEQPWWLVGAWTMWIAYVGLNVALPNLMLKLAPPGNASSYIATYYAIAGVFYGISTICGGALYDGLEKLPGPIAIGPWHLDHFQLLFIFGWITRTLGVVWLVLLIEPGARSLWEVVVGRRKS